MPPTRFPKRKSYSQLGFSAQFPSFLNYLFARVREIMIQVRSYEETDLRCWEIRASRLFRPSWLSYFRSFQILHRVTSTRKVSVTSSFDVHPSARRTVWEKYSGKGRHLQCKKRCNGCPDNSVYLRTGAIDAHSNRICFWSTLKEKKKKDFKIKIIFIKKKHDNKFFITRYIKLREARWDFVDQLVVLLWKEETTLSTRECNNKSSMLLNNNT